MGGSGGGCPSADAAAAAADAAAAPKRPAPEAAPGSAADAAAPPPRKKPSGKSKAGQRGRDAVETVDAPADELVRVVPYRRPPSTGGGAAATDDRVTLSTTDKAAGLVLGPDLLSVTGSRGFRSVRGSHGVHVGTWYAEVTLTHLGDTGHVRLGWATRAAEINAPVGYDAHGHGLRDVDGSALHAGGRTPYASRGLSEGDVVGLLLHLPAGGRRLLEPGESRLVRYKGALYALADGDDDVNCTGSKGSAGGGDQRRDSSGGGGGGAAGDGGGSGNSSEPQPLPGSLLGFSINGEWQGVAARDLTEGTYYPMVSLFTLPEQQRDAEVALNFGAEPFSHPPPELPGLPPPRALAEAAVDAAAAAAAVANELLAPAAAPAAADVATAVA
jgi:Set1/Ash2 histone methyltransferase complex subunit ASH2